MGLLLRSATLADGARADVRIEGESIAAVGPALDALPGDEVRDLGGRLLLPAFVEPHAHLDKAFLAERLHNPTGDLMGAINVMQQNRHTITLDDTIERAERAVRLLVSNGVTLIRSHADTTLENGLRSVEALVTVRERVRDICDLQVVCLTGWSLFGDDGPEMIALARAAIDAGVDVVGGCPHLDIDPHQANETLLALAAESGLAVDLHTDETLNPNILALWDLAKRVEASAFPYGVSASHCVSLGVQPDHVQEQVAVDVAAAGISVITLPQTNLFLQGRDHRVAQPRGLTAIPALREAGVNVAAGADNLQDPFNSVGKGDPLETAALMVMAGHLLPADAYESVSSAGRTALGHPAVHIAPGSPAELVAMPARDVREAIAFQPVGRLTVHRGRVVAGA